MATVKARKPATTAGVPTVPALSRPRTLVAEQDRARQLLERDNEVQRQSPLLDGRIVEGVYPDYGGTVRLIHRLDREVQGWFPIERQSPFTLYRVNSGGAEERNTITLARNDYAAPGDGAAVDSIFKIYVF